MSEKSVVSSAAASRYETALHTLRVQEIVDRHRVGAFIGMDRGVSEHLIPMALRSNSHVLLAKSLDVGINVRIFL